MVLLFDFKNRKKMQIQDLWKHVMSLTFVALSVWFYKDFSLSWILFELKENSVIKRKKMYIYVYILSFFLSLKRYTSFGVKVLKSLKLNTDLLLDKDFCQSRKRKNLALVNTWLWKLAKRGIFLTNFGIIHWKESLQFVIHAMYKRYCIVKLIFVNNKGLIPKDNNFF